MKKFSGECLIVFIVICFQLYILFRHDKIEKNEYLKCVIYANINCDTSIEERNKKLINACKTLSMHNQEFKQIKGSALCVAKR